MGVERKVDHCLRLLDPGHPVLPVCLLLLDGIGEEPGVEVESDRRHVARLLAPEDVAGSADLEVRERDLEARPELRCVEDRLESLSSLVGEPLAAPIEEIRICPARRSADPTAELVELREAERIGAVDDDRVRVRDVEPGFDDRRADEDVRLPCREGDHHLLERTFRHLAVADDDPGIGQELAELLGLGLDRLDPVVDEEDLAAPVELAQDGVADEAGRRFRDPRLDRQPVFRWRLDDGQVPDACEGEVQRAGNRRCRQGEDVDLAPKPLEAFLRRDAEALLLVDDDQAEVAEHDVLREEAVRPDHEVDRTVGDAAHRALLVALAHEPGQQPNRQRERAEALPEGLEMLGGQDGRRYEDRNLLAVLDRLEGGPQRDLGLAVPDVADDETIHRPARFHVELDLGHGAELVDRLLVRERRLELALPRGVRREGVAFGPCPCRIQLEQLLGEVAHRLADASLRPAHSPPPRRDSWGCSPPE